MTTEKKPSLAILVAISALNPLAMNIVSPSLPGLARLFSIDYGIAQLTLTVYLASIAVAQLILGPWSDRVGRRPLVLLGTLVFIAGSLICALAPSIGWLLFGRVVQAFGGCAGFVLARAMVRDLHGREASASMIGLITMVMVLAPMLSPLIGGAIDTGFGWRMVHVAMALTGAALGIYAWFALYETLHERRMNAGLGDLATSFATLLRDPAFRGHAISMGFTSASYFAFIAGAPYAVVELMGLEPHVYGVWFAIAASGYMAGNFISSRFGPQIGSRQLVRIGCYGALAAIVVLVAVISLLPLSPAALFLPMVLITFANGLTLPGATAGAISVRPDLAGAAAGLSGSLQLGLGAVFTFGVGSAMSGSVWPMIIGMALCCVLAVIGATLAENAESRAAKA